MTPQLRAYLEGVEARVAQATPGPWTWEDWAVDGGLDKHTLQAIVPFENESDRRLWEQTSPTGRPIKLAEDYDSDAMPVDRELLAHARTDLPRLLALLRVAAEGLTTIKELPVFAHHGEPYDLASAALATLDALAGEEKQR